MDSEQSLKARLQQVEADNARLRHLLDTAGVGTELRHQVRNTLSSMRAILRRSAETSTSVEDYAAHLEGRLDVLLRMQNTLTHRANGVELQGLLAEELRVFAVDEPGQARLSGPRILIRPQAAEMFALAFHELAANALKFGALSTPTGTVTVTWRLASRDTDVPRLRLSWEERGGPSESGAAAREGFGREVLGRMIRYQLKADVAWQLTPTGLRYEVDLPLLPSIGCVPREIPEADAD